MADDPDMQVSNIAHLISTLQLQMPHMTVAAATPSRAAHYPFDMGSEAGRLDAHSPSTRSVYTQLIEKIKDYETVYGTPDFATNDATNEPLDDTTIPRAKELREVVDHFKHELHQRFDAFARASERCDMMTKQLQKMRKTLQTVAVPQPHAPEPFETCMFEIMQSLTVLVDNIETAHDTAVVDRAKSWRDFASYRDVCLSMAAVTPDALCKTCYSACCSIALPCGHCFCESCASHFQLCPSCRAPVYGNTLKLFFG